MGAPVTGWRNYNLINAGLFDGPRLFGVRKVWMGKELIAECENGHHVPGEDCGCGIYALNKMEQAEIIFPDKTTNMISAIAYCTGWGKVIIHERGWRAERVRIERIILKIPHGTKYFCPLHSSGLAYKCCSDDIPIDELEPYLSKIYGVPIECQYYKPMNEREWSKKYTRIYRSSNEQWYDGLLESIMIYNATYLPLLLIGGWWWSGVAAMGMAAGHFVTRKAMRYVKNRKSDG